jgi:hypothetical protein
MIRISKWPGWVSNASPYILPAGGAVEQVNATSLPPGQLSVRGGMMPVATEGPQVATGGALLELWGYSTGSNQTEIVFAFTDAGEIVQFVSPSIEYTDPTPGLI